MEFSDICKFVSCDSMLANAKCIYSVILVVPSLFLKIYKHFFVNNLDIYDRHCHSDFPLST